MSSMSAFRAAALVVLLAAGCKKNPDPMHIDVADFETGRSLSDTIKRLMPRHARVPVVWEWMQSNGFRCGERSGTIIDTVTRKLGSGTPRLECWQSTRIDMGLRRRVWTVRFAHDTSGVHDVFADYIIQP